MLKRVPDANLRTHVVWMPMLRSDNRAEAAKASHEISDERITYFWDSDRVLGQAWAQSLGMRETAWDVYFLFKPEAEWADGTPVPQFWMHQLGLPEEMAPHLDADLLEQRIREFVLEGKD